MVRPLLAVVPLVLGGCAEQEFNIENNPSPSGDLAIRGRVCDTVTKTWLESALVYTHLYDDHDVVYSSASDYSDAEGNFELTNLVGGKDYELYTQVGHNIVDKQIVTLEDVDLELPTPTCAGTVELKVAVVTGAYDDLSPMLDAIGFSGVKIVDGQSSTEINDFLSDPVAMAEYDMIFFDGGHKEDGVIYDAGGTVQAVTDNLFQYVAAGGVVFASDWAYDVVELTWPNKIEFYGDDLVHDDAQVGEAGTILADVVDADLAQSIGGLATIEVNYDLSVWPVIESVDNSVKIQLRGDAPWRVGLTTGTVADAPLLVSFEEGEGEVVFTTYRNTANFTSESMLGVLVTIVNAITGGV
jgi:hypothetical protein